MEFDEGQMLTIKQTVEAAMLSSQEPISIQEMKRLFDFDISATMLKSVLAELSDDWASRSAELVEVASGWRFQVRSSFQADLNRLEPQRPIKYSRAVMETLAIIAYKQPVTRGDIEDIRGVAVSPNILKTLESRGWIDQIGVRETPGRPALFGTTSHFLDDLGLKTLSDLPPLDDLGELIDLHAGSSEQLRLDVDTVDAEDADAEDCHGEIDVFDEASHTFAGSKAIN